MPIDINYFESADNLRAPPTSECIIRFLLEHDSQAYTRREIASAIDVNPETVGTNLTRLKDRGLVRHREPYWALTADRDHAIDALHTRYDTLDDCPNTDDCNERVVSSDDLNQARDSSNTEMIHDVDSTSTTLSQAETTTYLHQEATTAFVERVRDRLDDTIDTLYLFGSVARHTATADSDVDVFAVITDDTDYVTVDDQLLDIAYDVQIEYGVRVEVHSSRASEFAVRRKRGDPLVRTVVEEGVVSV